MISRLRSNRLDFKSTCNRRHLLYSSMHYNYNTNNTCSGDHRDDERHYLTQLYPIQEMTDRMEKTLLDGVVDDYVQPPHHRMIMNTRIIDDDDDGDGRVYQYEDYSDSDDDSDSYDDLQYSDSDDDDDDIPSQELVVSILEDMGCRHKFQEALTPKPRNDVNSENIRNAPIIVCGSTRTNTSIAETRSLHCQKSSFVDKKKFETHQQQQHGHQNKQHILPTTAATTKTITACNDMKNKTDSLPPPLLHQHHHQLYQISSSSSSSSSTSVTTTTTPNKEAAGKRRRRRNYAMSQTDFVEVFRLLEANQ